MVLPTHKVTIWIFRHENTHMYTRITKLEQHTIPDNIHFIHLNSDIEIKKIQYIRTCYEKPLLWAALSYVRPLGHSPKWHFLYKWTSYEQPPALKSHFSCVIRVAAHSRFYCISNNKITIYILELEKQRKGVSCHLTEYEYMWDIYFLTLATLKYVCTNHEEKNGLIQVEVILRD